MKTVHKFPLTVQAQHSFLMPDGAVALHVNLDPNGTVCLWAFVDTDKPVTLRTFRITGTGHPVPDGLEYLGSVVQGNFVWHAWEQC